MWRFIFLKYKFWLREDKLSIKNFPWRKFSLFYWEKKKKNSTQWANLVCPFENGGIKIYKINFRNHDVTLHTNQLTSRIIYFIGTQRKIDKLCCYLPSHHPHQVWGPINHTSHFYMGNFVTVLWFPIHLWIKLSCPKSAKSQAVCAQNVFILLTWECFLERLTKLKCKITVIISIPNWHS